MNRYPLAQETTMNETQFDHFARHWSNSRRALLAGGLALTATRFGVPLTDARKKKRKQKKRKRRGGGGQTPGNICETELCLSAPFTIEAFGAQPVDDVTYLFVPPQDAMTGPAPYIEYVCSRAEYPCEQEYPFACIDGVLTGVGSEVTTIHSLLPGRYEYWIEVPSGTPAGGLTVVLSGSDGRDVRQWTNPAPTSPGRYGWHVFDIDGANGRVIDVDVAIDGNNLPDDAHDPHTAVCPSSP
jgi:hypothetical protein